MYKRQVQEYQIKAAEETKRADKAEFESKRHQEKLISVQKEKEVSMRGYKYCVQKLNKYFPVLWES